MRKTLEYPKNWKFKVAIFDLIGRIMNVRVGSITPYNYRETPDWLREELSGKNKI